MKNDILRTVAICFDELYAQGEIKLSTHCRMLKVLIAADEMLDAKARAVEEEEGTHGA